MVPAAVCSATMPGTSNLMPLPEAVRRLTALPADTLGLQRRGRVAPGYFSDALRRAAA